MMCSGLEEPTVQAGRKAAEYTQEMGPRGQQPHREGDGTDPSRRVRVAPAGHLAGGYPPRRWHCEGL